MVRIGEAPHDHASRCIARHVLHLGMGHVQRRRIYDDRQKGDNDRNPEHEFNCHRARFIANELIYARHDMLVPTFYHIDQRLF